MPLFPIALACVVPRCAHLLQPATAADRQVGRRNAQAPRSRARAARALRHKTRRIARGHTVCYVTHLYALLRANKDFAILRRASSTQTSQGRPARARERTLRATSTRPYHAAAALGCAPPPHVASCLPRSASAVLSAQCCELQGHCAYQHPATHIRILSLHRDSELPAEQRSHSATCTPIF